MNTASAQALRGAPVWTRSGEHVGRVEDIELDVDTGKLVHVNVRHGGWLKLVGVSHFVVPWNCVLEFSPEKVVIDDAFVHDMQPVTSPLGTPATPSAV